ncbi:MAG: hypothetical protein L6V81_05795 [Clostridium sp.]|nr:MAG: hypothetical protein L6V81_05795 [Clostridium sp.]
MVKKRKIIVKAMYGLTEMEMHDALDDLPNEFKNYIKKSIISNTRNSVLSFL